MTLETGWPTATEEKTTVQVPPAPSCWEHQFSLADFSSLLYRENSAVGTQKAARARCAILAYCNKMQLNQEKTDNSISNMHKVGKKMLLTGMTEFYQTGIVL